MHALAHHGAFDHGITIRNLCRPDRLVNQAAPPEMYEDAGMDVDALVRLAPGSRGRGAFAGGTMKGRACWPARPRVFIR